jgi:hypothetical protein
MPQVMRPEQSLAACYPEVASMWHPDRNENLTPDQIPPSAKHRVWWRCAAGHEWQDIVHTRILLPAWKRGDVAACKVCVGFHVIVAFDCGHTTDARAEYAEPHRGCPACRKVRRDRMEAEWFEQRGANSAAAKKLYAECDDRAKALLEDLPVPDVPAALLYEWRRTALVEIRGAIVSEDLFGKTGMVDTTLTRQQRVAVDLIPSGEQLRAAVAAREPLSILGKAHWPTGWLQFLDGRPAGPAAADDAALVQHLGATLAAEAALLVEEYGRGELRVAAVTKFLSGAVKQWADSQEPKWRSHRWITYRELSLPITPAGSTRFGRLDLTVMRPERPDLVIEIDSTSKAESAEKLAFARAAGAVAVWVRWHTGRVDAPDGVHVIDLVQASRGLAR